MANPSTCETATVAALAKSEERPALPARPLRSQFSFYDSPRSGVGASRCSLWLRNGQTGRFAPPRWGIAAAIPILQCASEAKPRVFDVSFAAHFLTCACPLQTDRFLFA